VKGDGKMFVDPEMMRTLRKLNSKDDAGAKIKFNQLMGAVIQRHAIEIFNLTVLESNRAVYCDIEEERLVGIRDTEIDSSNLGEEKYIKIYVLKSDWEDKYNLIRQVNYETKKLSEVFIKPDVTEKIQQEYLSDSEVTDIWHEDRVKSYFLFLMENQAY
jgi:hypothetical protein